MPSVWFSAVLALALAVCAFGNTPAPPDPKTHLPKYTINLDLEPEQRFVEPIQHHEKWLKGLVVVLKGLFRVAPGKETTDAMVAAFKKGLSDEYAREMRGIADILSMDYDDILEANLFYEITSVGGFADKGPVLEQLGRACTSLVAQNANGSMYLARNMDYPPPFAPLQFNAVFVRSGKTVYEGTMFAGIIGLVTGVAPGGFAVSINARTNFAPTLGQATAALEAGGHLFHTITRRALDTANPSFSEAISFFRDQPMVSPGYCIVAGSNRGEGAVVTTNTSAVGNDVWELKDGYGGDDASGRENWFLVETNWDHWESVDWIDGRRDFAKKNMEALGEDGVTLLGMWDVLSTGWGGSDRIRIPVYNFATIQTDFVDVASGEFHSYQRHCWGLGTGVCDMDSDSDGAVVV